MTINVLVLGTGEYVTGLTHGNEADSDKQLGVIGIVLFDLKKRGLIDEIRLCGQSGNRFNAIRHHFQANIADVYQGMDVAFKQYPENHLFDQNIWRKAIDDLNSGDAVIVASPDDAHYKMAQYALESKKHVLVVKPLVKSLKQHQSLVDLAEANQMVLAVEMHKRFDPFYADAKDRTNHLGQFSHFSSYMSQPKHQLETFKAWAGKASDISYYLNSHHIDWLVWALQGRARPIAVSAMAATGFATTQLNIPAEDTITLQVQWQNIVARTLGTSTHTASWIASKSDAHSQQRFFYMGHEGELQVNQANRGYQQAIDQGLQSLNPLFMKYTPSNGEFAGQQGYGYLSFEYFIQAVLEKKKGIQSEFAKNQLALGADTLQVTAILEAGRLSLDENKALVKLQYENDHSLTPTHLE